MNNANMAILFTPCLLDSYDDDPMVEMFNLKHYINTFSLLLERFDDIFFD